MQIRSSCAKIFPPLRARRGAWGQLPLQTVLGSGSSVWTSFRWNFLADLAALERAETWTRTSLRQCAFPTTIIFSREPGRYWETKGISHPNCKPVGISLYHWACLNCLNVPQLNYVIRAYDRISVCCKMSDWKIIMWWLNNVAFLAYTKINIQNNAYCTTKSQWWDYDFTILINRVLHFCISLLNGWMEIKTIRLGDPMAD